MANFISTNVCIPRLFPVSPFLLPFPHTTLHQVLVICMHKRLIIQLVKVEEDTFLINGKSIEVLPILYDI